MAAVTLYWEQELRGHFRITEMAPNLGEHERMSPGGTFPSSGIETFGAYPLIL